MKDKGKARASLVMAIEMLYLLPVIAISGFTLGLVPLNISWKIFSVGIFLSICGSITLFLLIKRWESSLAIQTGNLNITPLLETAAIDKEHIVQEAIAPWQRNHEKIVKELSIKEDELQQAFQEKKDLQEQILRIRKELDTQQELMRNQLMQAIQAHTEAQKTISEQAAAIARQTEHISHLDAKIAELEYEIKALALISSHT